MQEQIQPVILCGGAGTRLWPSASRGERAKQFLDIVDDASLFASTLARVSGRHFADPLVVCGPGHVATAREQSRDRPIRLLVEPAPRNTAAAIALAVVAAPSDALLLVMPSDHVTSPMCRPFTPPSTAARRSPARIWLVTFGITPDRPETGFGYIKSGAALRSRRLRRRTLCRKAPCARKRRAMLSTGDYSWNAGIFLFRARVMRDAMRTHCPAILDAAEWAIAASRVEGPAIYADRETFESSPGGLDRLCGDGKARPSRGRTRFDGLVGSRQLERRSQPHHARRGRKRRQRGCVSPRQPRMPRARRRPPRIAHRHGGCRGGRRWRRYPAVMPLARSQDVRAAAQARE